MSTLTRRSALLRGASFTVITTSGLAACDTGAVQRNVTGAVAPNSARIDARVDATLAEMYAEYPQTRSIGSRSQGMLIMPLITEAGLGFGGGYGRGALRVGGVSVAYYSATKANVGLQIGANQYAHVLFFMTEESLRDFRTSDGWAAGADVDATFLSDGQTLSTDTATAMSPVVGIIFGQAGVRLGATIEGTKYSPISV